MRGGRRWLEPRPDVSLSCLQKRWLRLRIVRRRCFQGDMSLQEWLRDVPAALSAIAFGPHKDLIKLVLRVLASAPPAADASGPSDVADEAAACLCVLLQHPVPAVPAQTWGALRKLLTVSAAPDTDGTVDGLLRLLSHAPLMRHMIVICAANDSEERHEDIANILSHVLAARDLSVRAGGHLTSRSRYCVADSHQMLRAPH